LSNEELQEEVQAALASGLVSLDIESSEFDKEEDLFRSDRRIDIIGFCHKWPEGIVVTPDQFPLLKPLFEPGAVTFLGHNFLSDMMSLIPAFNLSNIEDYKIEDTMLLFHALYSDFPKKLACTASFFSNMKYWKHLMEAPGQMAYYNACDTVGTYESFQNMKKDLATLQVEEAYHAMLDIIPFAYQMYSRGANLDVLTAKRLQLKYAKVNQAIEAIF
jgi:hypothetical protein